MGPSGRCYWLDVVSLVTSHLLDDHSIETSNCPRHVVLVRCVAPYVTIVDWMVKVISLMFLDCGHMGINTAN